MQLNATGASRKRIFIKQLPTPTISQSDIESCFGQYGNVIAVEIKSRNSKPDDHQNIENDVDNKSSNHHQQSLFAYVTLEINDSNLQQCFKYFAKNRWLGQYVDLQIAKESFLERLKREREDSGREQENVAAASLPPPPLPSPRCLGNTKKIYTSDDDDNNIDNSSSLLLNDDDADDKGEKSSSIVDLIIKNNRGKTLDKCGGLKIAGVGNEPIIKVTKVGKKRKSNNNINSESDLKRIQSLDAMVNGYRQQKTLLQNALSNVDFKPKNKIVFDENGTATSHTKNPNQNDKNKPRLFRDDDDDNDTFHPNFKIDKHFEGKTGAKLLELQSKYRNDKRFNLDKRFVADNDQIENNNNDNNDDDDDETAQQYQILGKVLGETVRTKRDFQSMNHDRGRGMLRFDPNQPDHANYERIRDVAVTKEKKQRNVLKSTTVSDVDQQQQQPVVSKDVFYKVSEDYLKEALLPSTVAGGGGAGFSLLSAYGRGNNEDNEEKVKNNEDDEYLVDLKRRGDGDERNPFRYESSSDDDDEEIKKKSATSMTSTEVNNKINQQQTTTTSWHEPFFFKEDDYRLQEGFDFMQRMASSSTEIIDGESAAVTFEQTRRDLKQIVRAKVRNNLRHNRPFKKQLGGASRRKKVLRLKKAIRR